MTSLPTELVRERRRALKLTQQEAAEQAGISRNEWNQIENGKRGIGAVNAGRIATVLGGSPEEYLTRAVGPGLDELRREIAELKRRVRDLEERRRDDT